MDRLPIFLQLTGKPCLVVGGGAVAERKIHLLQRTGASISVLASSITASLQTQIDQGRLIHLPGQYSNAAGAGFWLIIAATDDESLNHRIAADAEAAGRFCNVVDDNAASSFILPAIVDRSPIIVAIGTEGNAPVLAQQLKSKIEAWIPARIGDLATQAGRWRGLVKKRFERMPERRRFWQRFDRGALARRQTGGR